MLNYVSIDTIIQIVLMVIIFLFVRYGEKIFSDDLMKDAKSALAVAGLIVRGDKLTQLVDVAKTAVLTIEANGADYADNSEKHAEAMARIYKSAEGLIGRALTQKELDTLIQVAVAYLPKTN